MKYPNLLYVLFVLCFGHAQMSQAQSIDTLMSLALKQNPMLLAKEMDYKSAVEKVVVSGNLPDPQLSTGIFILPVETRVGARVFDIGISQKLPWFGSLTAEKSVAEKLALAKFQDLQNMRKVVFLDLKHNYYQLWFLSETYSIETDYLASLERQEQTLLNKVEAGQSTIADVLRVQMEKEQSKVRLQIITDEQMVVISKLNMLINEPQSNVIQVQNDFKFEYLESLPADLDSLLQIHPKLKSISSRINAKELESELVRKNQKPNISVGLNYGNVIPRTDVNVLNNGRDILMPMATISIPLNQKRNNARIKETEIQKMALQYEMEAQKNELIHDYSSISAALLSSNRQIELYTDLLLKGEQTLELLKEYFASGSIDYEVVLRMEQQLLQFRKQKLAAQLDMGKAYAKLSYLFTTTIIEK